MFGFGKEKSAKKEKSAQTEEAIRRTEAVKKAVDAAFVQMRGHADAGLTDRCEAAEKRLIEVLKSPDLDLEYIRQVRRGTDRLILQAFMKATAIAAKQAIDAGKADDSEKRTAKIKEAREKLAGAIKYKAPREFEQQCERMLEVAMFSGGVKSKGATAAKPLDMAPRVENRAKPGDTARAASKTPKDLIRERNTYANYTALRQRFK
jgi:hypothetical protein